MGNEINAQLNGIFYILFVAFGYGGEINADPRNIHTLARTESAIILRTRINHPRIGFIFGRDDSKFHLSIIDQQAVARLKNISNSGIIQTDLSLCGQYLRISDDANHIAGVVFDLITGLGFSGADFRTFRIHHDRHRIVGLPDVGNNLAESIIIQVS